MTIQWKRGRERPARTSQYTPLPVCLVPKYHSLHRSIIELGRPTSAANRPVRTMTNGDQDVACDGATLTDRFINLIFHGVVIVIFPWSRVGPTTLPPPDDPDPLSLGWQRKQLPRGRLGNGQCISNKGVYVYLYTLYHPIGREGEEEIRFLLRNSMSYGFVAL